MFNIEALVFYFFNHTTEYLSSTRLGNTVKDRTALIGKVMIHLAELPFVHSDMEIDMLGDAYEFLIGRLMNLTHMLDHRHFSIDLSLVSRFSLRF
jgi:hypothetical protein